MFENSAGNRALRILTDHNRYIGDQDTNLKLLNAAKAENNMRLKGLENVTRDQGEILFNFRKKINQFQKNIDELIERTVTLAELNAMGAIALTKTAEELGDRTNKLQEQLVITNARLDDVGEYAQETAPWLRSAEFVGGDGGQCNLRQEDVIQAILDYLKLDIKVQPGEPETACSPVAVKKKAAPKKG